MKRLALPTISAVLVSCTLVLGQVASPAAACACGAPAPPIGSDVNVGAEHAMIRWDGDLEEIVLQLDLTSDAGSTGLIFPTPSPATVTAGDPELFESLRDAMQPEIITEYDWWGLGGLLGSDGAPGDAGAGPEVLARVQLGPIEATTLAASDSQGLTDWLTTNGYGLSDAVTAELPQYIDDGWSFVALKLTGDEPLDGALDPVTFTFETDSLVYPMRMSHAAEFSQSVRLWVLGDHRAVVTGGIDVDSSVAWAGPVDDPDLADLGAYMTVVDLFWFDPLTITEDLAIADAPNDDTDIPVQYRTEWVSVAGIPAGPLIVLGGIVVFVVGLVVLVRVVARRPVRAAARP